MKKFITLIIICSAIFGGLGLLNNYDVIAFPKNVLFIAWMWISIAIIGYYVYLQRKRRKENE